MIWLVLEVARRRGSWFLFALPLFALGGLVLWITHPLHFVRVGGTVASYRDVTTFTNSYDHSELRLVGDPKTYKLDKWSLHPRLLEGMPVQVAFHNGAPLYLELPVTVELEVTHTEPGLQGDRSSAGTKPATLETGAQIQVPLFINTGDKLKVDSRDGSYLGRVNA